MNLWVFLVVVVFMTNGATTEESSNSNGLTSSSSPRELDLKLRNALLKALNELENEESESHPDKLVERAPASSFTIYDNSKSDVDISPKQSDSSTIIYPTEIINSTTETNKSEIDSPLVILQKSEGVQEKTITSFEEENSELNSNDVEQFISSASSSLTSNVNQLHKSNVATAPIETTNEIKTNLTTALSENQPSTSTEENELRVENVQFFSAPLVAAFTVHQDELGLPRKVESIFKEELPSKLDTYFNQNKLLLQEPQKLNALQQEQIQQNGELVKQQQLKLEKVKQGELLRKQKIQQEQSHKFLEERLKSTFNFKPQQISINQEPPRVENNAISFLPIHNTGFNGLIGNNLQSQQLPTTLSVPFIDRLPVTEPISNIQQLPVKPAEAFDQNAIFQKDSVSVLPSITFDPLIEAGKLPINAQILPVKPPINFNAPILQTPQFQQYHSLSPFNINVNQLQPLPSLVQPQSNRIFRQESGVGNFLNTKNTDTVIIQQSIQPPPLVSTIPNYFPESNRFLRSNIDNFKQQAFSQRYPQQGNRVFRSNPESVFLFPNNFYRPQQNYYHLNNLLFKRDTLRKRRSDDFNIFTNILEQNRSGNQRYANSVRQIQRIPNYQKL